MISFTRQQIKLLLIILIDLYFRSKKLINFIWYRKHEVQRICEDPSDIYEKTMGIDQWLSRTKCKPICNFIDQHFGRNADPQSSLPQKAINKILMNYRENQANLKGSKRRKSGVKNTFNLINLEDGDIILSSVLRELTTDLLRVIDNAKHLHEMPHRFKKSLSDSLYRILSYKLSIMLAEQLAATKYDSNLEIHTTKLINLWNNLLRADQEQSSQCDSSPNSAFPPELSTDITDKSNLVSSRWSHIGFQGEDPGTDFRGMGILGLAQLEYLSRKPKRLARDLLKRSLNDEHSYPFAIVGINITYILLNMMKDGSMKHLYYDTGDILFRNNQRTLNVLTTFNDLYAELFLRFDCFWHESKPETIFQFKPLMEEFVSIVKMDLCNRNFSMKFIY